MEKGIRDILERRFDDALIKTRPGSYGKTLHYVDSNEIIDRLNEAFEGDWSFEIVSHEIIEGEVVVKGKLTAGGVTKMAFGGCEIKHKKDGGEIVSLADDMKAAATDALKKSATFLGLGLYLYSDNISVAAKAAPQTSRPSSGAATTKPAAAKPPAPSGAPGGGLFGISPKLSADENAEMVRLAAKLAVRLGSKENPNEKAAKDAIMAFAKGQNIFIKEMKPEGFRDIRNFIETEYFS